MDWSRPGAPDLPDQVSLAVFGCQVGHEWQAGHPTQACGCRCTTPCTGRCTGSGVPSTASRHGLAALLRANTRRSRSPGAGRVLRQHLENPTIGEVTLGDALVRATWAKDLAGGAEVHRARLDDREVWVLRCPSFLGSNQTLVPAVAADGWSMHVLAPQA